MQDIYTDLINCIPKENVYKDEPMSKHTTFKIGGPAKIFIKIKYAIVWVKKVSDVSLFFERESKKKIEFMRYK